MVTRLLLSSKLQLQSLLGQEYLLQKKVRRMKFLDERKRDFSKVSLCLEGRFHSTSSPSDVEGSRCFYVGSGEVLSSLVRTSVPLGVGDPMHHLATFSNDSRGALLLVR
ncbi:hypothetical protein M569_00409 [Genlisea aurea]|uniref:Uncharacterized protein n=1 Tax=Genlisea aurea TaxID=192259 RepID=S8ENF9_9LAMI|nr:hypothetical protein M569_00409 [Genlisea aurea]